MSDDHLYLNVVDPLNTEFEWLRQRLKRGDCRVGYLLDFEIALSASMKQNSLQEDKHYREFLEKNKPLPENRYIKLPYEEFRAWITAYELVMRDHFLIGSSKKAPMIGGIIGNYAGGKD